MHVSCGYDFNPACITVKMEVCTARHFVPIHTPKAILVCVFGENGVRHTLLFLECGYSTNLKFHFHYTDFADIIRALYDAKVTNKWLEIGLFLGISFGQLQTLKSKSDDDRVSEMVGFWTRWSYEFVQFGKPSWKNLVRAIGARAGGNARRAAKRIADKHKLGSAESTLSIQWAFYPSNNPCTSTLVLFPD